jgi:LacI family transcriptional regulator
MANPITITQIADAAGVSTATVDRVLNGRPGVNPATVQKVMAAMQAMGGGTPARGRPRASPNYRFAFVLPAARRGFFDQVDRVIAQAAGDFRHQHITEVTHRLPAEDPAAFAAELSQLSDFDGLAVLAPDVPAVKLALNDLVRAGVHVVTLFCDVPGSMRAAFVGADNRAAGRTAGLLLSRAIGHRAARVALCCPDSRYTAEIDREIGFTHALQERAPAAELLRIADLPAGDDAACAHVERALAAESDGTTSTLRLSAAYVVGAGSHGVSRALQAQGYGPALTVAAHDLLEVHRAMLVAGHLTYVLHQDVYYAVMTGTKVLRSLCDGVRGALAVSNPHVEIMTAENLA